MWTTISHIPNAVVWNAAAGAVCVWPEWAGSSGLPSDIPTLGAAKAVAVALAVALRVGSSPHAGMDDGLVVLLIHSSILLRNSFAINLVMGSSRFSSKKSCRSAAEVELLKCAPVTSLSAIVCRSCFHFFPVTFANTACKSAQDSVASFAASIAWGMALRYKPPVFHKRYGHLKQLNLLRSEFYSFFPWNRSNNVITNVCVLSVFRTFINCPYVVCVGSFGLQLWVGQR